MSDAACRLLGMAEIKFLHTADLQLGMTRYFLDSDAQARYDSARITVISTLGELAREQGCAFIVVAGDVFESNNLSRRTVGRSLQAFGEVGLPIFLLPGNHDPLEPGSIFDSGIYKREWPSNLHVLRGEPLPVPGLENVVIHGAPWTSKNPLGSPLNPVLGEGYVVDKTLTNILVGHGAVDSLAPDPLAVGVIKEAPVEEAVRAGKFDYVALGDRHSTAEVGGTGRIWYSGSPEVTAFRDKDAGNALVVTLDDAITVESHRVGTWRFLRVPPELRELHSAQDVADLDAYLASLPNPALTAVRHELSGALSLAELAELEEVLERHGHVLGSIGARESTARLVTVPSAEDLASLQLTGYAATALTELQQDLAGDGEQSIVAAGALQLLHRIVQEEK